MIFFFENALERGRGEDEKWLEFAEMEEAGDGVDVGGGEEDAARLGNPSVR